MESTTTMKTTTTTAAATTTSLLLTSGASGRVNALLSLRALRGLLMVINAFLLLLLVPFRIRFRTSSNGGVGGVGGGTMNSSSSSSSSPMAKAVEKQQQQQQQQTKVLRVGYTRRSNLVAEDHDVVKRRSLAVRNANRDGDTRSAREVSFFVTKRGDTLFTQSWTPVSSKIRALVVLLHGLNEHSGRYSDFAKTLNANGYKVYGMDWTGHGGSDGLHGYVHSLDDAVDDLKAFLEKVVGENPGFPCFCFGHSTGGAIVLKALLDPKIEKLVDGVVVTSPAVGVQPSHPIFGVLAPIFSYLVPKYQFSAANKNGVTVSRDPEALIAKYSDPLVFTGAIRVRTGSEILRISAYLQQNSNRLTVPFFVLHGTDDAVTNPEASQKFYEEASSTDKSIKLYEGLLHDILFEPEKETITNDIIEWLNSRV